MGRRVLHPGASAQILGKILRIDVDAKGASTPYGIPSDNPFTNAGPTVRGEIWAYGFRNAWRMCFEGQDLYVGSPGAKMYEWVTKVARGANHGWPYWEGFHQYEIPVPPNLANQKMEKPVFEYERAPGEEQTAIIGGCFYHGDRIKPLQGKYLCADYGRGDVYAVDLAGDKSMRVAAKVPNASSIGTDLQNEVYVTSFDGGKVYTLAP